MPSNAAITDPFSGWLKIFSLLLLSCAAGCHQGQYAGSREDLAQRILPPATLNSPTDCSTAGQPSPETSNGSPVLLGQPRPAEAPESAPARSPAIPQGGEICTGPRGTLTLPDAIALAFRLQPRLRASLESIQQARGREDIAFAAFLPVLTSGYSVGAFELNVGGANLPLPGLPTSLPFTFMPFSGALPVGLELHTGYELAELKLQYLICDFGRRLGRYRQAGLAADIAQLQTERAYQTVANDVAVAYYQMLRTRSLRRIAAEAVRRGQDDLNVARKLARGGVVEREKVLRAEVALSQDLRALDITEEAEAVAVAALNRAIGLNVSTSTVVADTTDVPSFSMGLAECLRAAIDARREFQVARQSVQAAQEGTRVACADFAPRIVGEGYLNDFQQSSPRGHADLALGFIKLEWGLFEGGKRVAELRVADSRVREALAEADSIADTIAYEVNQAYRVMVAARKGIDHSRPAVDQTREAYRLVVARSRQGDATPAELTDAAASLTRAEQDYFNAVYDYLTALARLQYAMGTAPTPTTPGSCQ